MLKGLLLLVLIVALSGCSSGSSSSGSGGGGNTSQGDYTVGTTAVYDVTTTTAQGSKKSKSYWKAASQENGKTRIEGKEVDDQGKENKWDMDADGDILNVGKKVFDFCDQNHSPFENITVPAGTFKTCKIISTDPKTGEIVSTYWYGLVPFGTVRSISTYDKGKTTYTSELSAIQK